MTSLGTRASRSPRCRGCCTGRGPGGTTPATGGVRRSVSSVTAPTGAPQSLARTRKDVIALVAVEHMGLKPDQYDIESMSLLFYDAVIRGVELRIREKNWALLITFLREEDIPP